jgi:hypothetical protein
MGIEDLNPLYYEAVGQTIALELTVQPYACAIHSQLGHT